MRSSQQTFETAGGSAVAPVATGTSGTNTLVAGAACFVGFSVADQVYAFGLDQVDQILRMVEVTKVPEEPDWVAGAINLHGTQVLAPRSTMVTLFLTGIPGTTSLEISLSAAFAQPVKATNVIASNNGKIILFIMIPVLFHS